MGWDICLANWTKGCSVISLCCCFILLPSVISSLPADPALQLWAQIWPKVTVVWACLSLGDQLSCVHGHERHVGPHGVPVQAQLRWSHHLCGPKVHQCHWLPAPGLWPLGMGTMGRANAENPICKHEVFVADNSYIMHEMLFVFLCCPCLCVGCLFIPLDLIKILTAECSDLCTAFQ